MNPSNQSNSIGNEGAVKVADVLGVLGTPIVVAIIPPGGRYGRTNTCINHGWEPMVEFYDGRGAPGGEWYQRDPGRYFPLGQFINRYHLSALLRARAIDGLDLDDGAPAWKLSPTVFREAMDRVVVFLNGKSLSHA